MGILERLKEPRSSQKRCKMAVILHLMTEQESEEVQKVLASIAGNEGIYSASWLSLQLRKENYLVNHASIIRHARKECCCHVA